MDRTDEDRATEEPVDWRVTYHSAQTSSSHRDAVCRLCGATALKAIHDKAFATSRGYDFRERPAAVSPSSRRGPAYVVGSSQP
jgi:PIN domain nuclease of toxin-antitoxin system